MRVDMRALWNIGDYFAEARLLNVAHRFQQTTDWHLRQAPTSSEEA